jgi:hypothetical protein
MLLRSARRLRFCSRAAVAVFGLTITLLLGFGGTPAAAQAISAVNVCSSAIQQALASQFTPQACNTGFGTTNIICSTDGTTACTFTGACTGSITVPSPGEFTNNTTTCVGGGTVLTPSGPFATTASALLFQSLARIAQQTSQISLQAVQTEITSIRDSVQRRLRSTPRPIGFAGDVAEDRIDSSFKAIDASLNTLDDSLAAFAYTDSKSPIVSKAAPSSATPTSPRISYAGWAQGFVDYENRTGTFLGTDIGRNTLTGGVMGGVDATVLNLTSATDAGVVGVLTGDTTASVHNADGSMARMNGPSVGAYGVYINGGFSTDGTFKVDFLHLAQDTAGVDTPLALNNYTGAGNVSYKNEVATWWWEPTAGVSYIRTVWDGGSKATFGLTDGTDVRVTGGVRWGTGWDWAGMHFDGTLSTFLYDDVIISGGTVTTAIAPLAPTDAGKIFGQLIGKLEAKITQNFSAYLEGEVRGKNDVIGTAGRLGVRYTFN